MNDPLLSVGRGLRALSLSGFGGDLLALVGSPAGQRGALAAPDSDREEGQRDGGSPSWLDGPCDLLLALLFGQSDPAGGDRGPDLPLSRRVYGAVYGGGVAGFEAAPGPGWGAHPAPGCRLWGAAPPAVPCCVPFPWPTEGPPG